MSYWLFFPSIGISSTKAITIGISKLFCLLRFALSQWITLENMQVSWQQPAVNHPHSKRTQNLSCLSKLHFPFDLLVNSHVRKPPVCYFVQWQLRYIPQNFVPKVHQLDGKGNVIPHLWTCSHRSLSHTPGSRGKIFHLRCWKTSFSNVRQQVNLWSSFLPKWTSMFSVWIVLPFTFYSCLSMFQNPIFTNA